MPIAKDDRLLPGMQCCDKAGDHCRVRRGRIPSWAIDIEPTQGDRLQGIDARRELCGLFGGELGQRIRREWFGWLTLLKRQMLIVPIDGTGPQLDMVHHQHVVLDRSGCVPLPHAAASRASDAGSSTSYVNFK
jgi:hypothetical protein